MGIKSLIVSKRFENDFMYWINRLLYEVGVFFIYKIHSDKKNILNKYVKVFGYIPDLSNPQTLNEKIQWLKLNDHKDFNTICADKYAVRGYLEQLFGSEYLIPLIFHTDDWREITPKNINQYPCIIKANHTSGDFVILRSEADANWETLRRKCRWWLKRDFYTTTQEWQYKNIHRQIVVERLLQTSEKKIPNDYKLHYINGELQFVYVSVDREGVNKRNIYDKYWNPLYFSWVPKSSNPSDIRGAEIDVPKSFEKMKALGKDIASKFKYVRVDFYDVDGKVYFGEITLHHGGGYDVFYPGEYDLYYGKILKL